MKAALRHLEVSLCPVKRLLLPYIFPGPILLNRRKAKITQKIGHPIKISLHITYLGWSLYFLP